MRHRKGTKMKLAIGIVAGCFVASALLAASTSLQVESRTFFVGTGTAGGKCLIRALNGKHETVCMDGPNTAAVSAADGCLDSSGKGSCTVGPQRPAGFVGSQLTCVSGRSYYLWVGPQASCKLSGTSKTCTAPDGTSSATADCAEGCGNTAGVGSCCAAGTAGCPAMDTKAKPKPPRP